MTTLPIKAAEDTPVHQVSLFNVGKKYHFLKKHEKGYEDGFWALKGLSFIIDKGEVLAIIGRNGAGKTTLLNIIAGALSPTEGVCHVNGRVLGLFNLGVGFQDELSGRENIFLNGAIVGASRKELQEKVAEIH